MNRELRSLVCLVAAPVRIGLILFSVAITITTTAIASIPSSVPLYPLCSACCHISIGIPREDDFFAFPRSSCWFKLEAVPIRSYLPSYSSAVVISAISSYPSRPRGHIARGTPSLLPFRNTQTTGLSRPSHLRTASEAPGVWR